MYLHFVRWFFAFFFLFIHLSLYAQQRSSISGSVKDKNSGELLPGATVRVMDLPSTAVVANEYGFYSLSLVHGTYRITVSYVGYADTTLVVTLKETTKLNWFLEQEDRLEEVVISSARRDQNLSSAMMGTETLNIQAIARLPVLFGEKDVMKTIQLLPGVKSTGEGSSGFSVRGGAADQNLILLDEAAVYNASHLLGFFSTFNSDALKDASIIKGNSPAQYGGRLSSVLDVKMKDGNNQRFETNGGVGLISSRLSVEGPLQKDRSSFIVSGRRTYADLFLKATEDLKDSRLYFYDLNIKANYQLTDQHRIYASGYFGRDVLGLGDTFGTDWGNATATLRWNSVWNSQLFSNTSLIYSNYQYRIQIKSGATDFGIQSQIRDWNLKQDYSWFAHPKHAVRFGIQSIYHTLTPGTYSGTVRSSYPENARDSWENALYFQDDFKWSDRLTIQAGIRLSGFSVLGGDTYQLFKQGQAVGQVNLKAGKIGKTYVNAEPRLTMNYRTGESSSVKMGYARNVQNLHLLSNSNGGNPTDQWIGSSYTVRPEVAHQYSVGLSKNLQQNNYEINVESYYKQLLHQIDFKNGADLRSVADVESELLFGRGRAYGLELMVKKKNGALTGWISYTLSRTERKIEGINDDQWYNARQDKTHDLSVVASYTLSPKWSLSGLFVYGTGNAVTFPTGKYELEGQTIFQYGRRNADRMPDYHRLDLSATYEPTHRKKFKGSWTFGVYNGYGRENAYAIDFEDHPDKPGTTRAMQTALFRWVPNVTYNFKF